MPTYSYVLGASGAPGTSGISALPTLAHETDHSGTGLARVIAQYVPAVRLRSILDILLDGEAIVDGGPLSPTGVQSAEDLLWQLYTERGLIAVLDGGPAIGEQLDVIGEIVGLERLAIFLGSDDTYRAALSLVVRINKTDCSPDDIIALVSLAQLLAGSTEFVRMDEYYPCAFSTTMGLVTAAFAAGIWPILRRAKPAGVRWFFQWSAYGADDTFQYSTELAATETDVDSGYGDLTLPVPATGGHYMGLSI